MATPIWQHMSMYASACSCQNLYVRLVYGGMFINPFMAACLSTRLWRHVYQHVYGGMFINTFMAACLSTRLWRHVYRHVYGGMYACALSVSMNIACVCAKKTQSCHSCVCARCRYHTLA